MIVVSLNLLIAVVIDSYIMIKDNKTEEAFWSSRLDFVTEVELMKHVIRVKWIKDLFHWFQNKCESSEDNRSNFFFILFTKTIWPAVTKWLWKCRCKKDCESLENSIKKIKETLESVSDEISNLKNILNGSGGAASAGPIVASQRAVVTTEDTPGNNNDPHEEIESRTHSTT